MVKMDDTWQEKLRRVYRRLLPVPIRRPIGQFRDWLAARQWAYLAGHRTKVLQDLGGGLQMFLYTDSELSRLIRLENFSATERWFTREFLRPRDVYVDVGANAGLFTLTAAQAVGSSGRVFGFEPSPLMFSRLQENVALNGFRNVSCHQLALSSGEGEAEMAVARDEHDGWSSLAGPRAGAAFKSETVRTSTWARFATENGLVGRVALMKMDVEGWERQVLLGGREVFARADAPVLYVEFTDRAAGGPSCAQLYALLEELGFGLYAVDLERRAVISAPRQAAYADVNLVAAKDPQKVNERLSRTNR